MSGSSSSGVLYSSDINGVPSVLATPIVGEGVEIFSEEFVDGCSGPLVHSNEVPGGYGLVRWVHRWLAGCRSELLI